MERYAIIRGMGADRESSGRYLPANYKVTAAADETVVIRGEDSCGWTLDDYVLPRLASGLYFGSEVTGGAAGYTAKTLEG